MTFLIKDFVQRSSLELLAKLQPNQTPKWGTMSPQQMVEHVSGVILISRKDFGIPCASPEEKLPALKQFLWNDQPMKKDFYVKGVHPARPAPLRNKDLNGAIALFAESIQKFYKHYQENPDDKKMHPIFGLLNFEEWERFHYKHIYHHFTQFGLLAETEQIPLAR
jgi:hypothetical protein